MSSSDGSFQTAISDPDEDNNETIQNLPAVPENQAIIFNSQAIPEQEITLDSVEEKNGHNIDTLLNKYGFFLVTKRCRAVCIKNGPETAAELEKAENLKAKLPEFVKSKIKPQANSDDETPKNLLVTLNDVGQENETETVIVDLISDEEAMTETDADVTVVEAGKLSSKPPDRRQPEIVLNQDEEMEIIINDVEELSEKMDVVVEEEAGKSSCNPPESEPETEISLDAIDKSKIVAKPTQRQGTLTKFFNISPEKSPVLQKNKNLEKPKINNNNNEAAEKQQTDAPSSSTSSQHKLWTAGSVRGPCYTGQEEKCILRYVLDGNFEELVKGNGLWKKMAEDGICPGRTWQSLKNRFKRYIVNNLSRPEFKLTVEEKERIKKPKYGAYSRKKQRNAVKDLQPRKQPKLSREAPGFYDMDIKGSDSDSSN